MHSRLINVYRRLTWYYINFIYQVVKHLFSFKFLYKGYFVNERILNAEFYYWNIKQKTRQKEYLVSLKIS
jgi:hypothetical protein